MIRGIAGSPGIRRVLAAPRPGDQAGDACASQPPGPGREQLHLPGDLELHQLCANARRLARICDTVGIPAPDVATYDPDPPYIWDVDA